MTVTITGHNCTPYHVILLAGSDWLLVSTDVLTLLSPYGVSSLYHCEMERLILMSSLLHHWTGKVLCHSEIIETAVLTDLTSAGTV